MYFNNSNETLIFDLQEHFNQHNKLIAFQVAVDLYIALPVILFGIGGNLLSIIVLGRDSYVKKTTGYLLQMLALADLLFLLTCLVSQPLQVVVRYRQHWLPGFLKYWNYIDPFLVPCLCIAQFAAVYMVVLVTADRYIAICRPLHAPHLSTLPRMRKAVVAIWVVSILYNMPRFFEKKLVLNEDGYHEAISTSLLSNTYYSIIYTTLLYFLVRYLVPVLALLFCNYRLIVEIRKSSRLHHGGESNNEKYTMTLVVIVLVFLLCETPDFFLRIHHTVHNLSNTLQIAYPTIAYMNIICIFFHTVNSSINFAIYCFMGQRFRNILKRMFACKEKRDYNGSSVEMVHV